nr:dynein intermediate chain 3, ciliary-like [Penaeus vannamei]
MSVVFRKKESELRVSAISLLIAGKVGEVSESSGEDSRLDPTRPGTSRPVCSDGDAGRGDPTGAEDVPEREKVRWRSALTKTKENSSCSSAPHTSLRQRQSIAAKHTSTEAKYMNVNTETIDFASTGMNHTEGGWPKDVSTTEDDQKVRYRKKIEKDDVYIHSMLQLDRALHPQNNAIDIYEMYFEAEESPMVEEPDPIKTVNVIRDPHGGQRMVTSVSFAPEGGHKIAAATHCSSSPELDLHAPSWLQYLQYNPKDPHVIAAGLYNGQVSWWDTRQGPRPVESTSLEVSHAQTVTALTWMAHKTRSELFTVSTDGRVLWWDTRKLSQPTDTLVLDPLREDPPNISKALSATCVEYEVTMPTKLMVATEQGQVVACNRRARSPPDRISMIYNAHIAPIYAIQRNPFFLKNFMTVGDWTIKLWAEDFKESPFLWTKTRALAGLVELVLMRSGSWSASRSSVMFTARLDGALDAWDLLTSWSKPAASVQVVDEALETVTTHEGGRLLVAGSQLGTLSLLHLPSRLVMPSDKHEKAAFTAVSPSFSAEYMGYNSIKKLRTTKVAKRCVGTVSVTIRNKKHSKIRTIIEEKWLCNSEEDFKEDRPE